MITGIGINRLRRIKNERGILVLKAKNIDPENIKILRERMMKEGSDRFRNIMIYSSKD